MTQVIGKMKLLKWWMPLLLVAALVAAGGVAWSQQGGSDGVLPQFADQNPAYENVVVNQPELAVPLLYMIEMDPPTAVVVLGTGDIATVVLTNLIPEPLPNYTPYMKDLQTTGFIMRNGDLTGNVTVTAALYNTFDKTGCMGVWPDASPASTQVIKFENITVHPGKTVTFQVPIFPAYAPAGAIFLLKSEFAINPNPLVGGP
jgi:hypothetical protein